MKEIDYTLWPKVDLHLHLDGSVKPSTWIDLALQMGMELPSRELETLASFMQVQGETCGSLREYLSKFHFTGKVLHSPEALQRIACEVVEQTGGQNCKYIEVRFAPQLHRERGLSVEEVIYYVLEGLKQGEERYEVKARGIAVCMRNHDERQNLEVIEAARTFLDRGIVGVDLAGDEAGYPASLFTGVFQAAIKRDIPITIHAGEAAGPENIFHAVEKLGARRIGHGVRLKEDPKVYRLVKRRRIPLEMCPISNIQTKAAPGWKDYPIREYFDDGLFTTVNTDNLTVSNTNLSKEYGMLEKHQEFRPNEVRELIFYAVDAAFLPDSEKKELRRIISEEFMRLGPA